MQMLFRSYENFGFWVAVKDRFVIYSTLLSCYFVDQSAWKQRNLHTTKIGDFNFFIVIYFMQFCNCFLLAMHKRKTQNNLVWSPQFGVIKGFSNTSGNAFKEEHRTSPFFGLQKRKALSEVAKLLRVTITRFYCKRYFRQIGTDALET